MAEHRAAVNALHALFLVRGDTEVEGAVAGLSRRNKSQGQGQARGQGLKLPTESHGDWALEGGKIGKGLEFVGRGWGGGEVVVESGKRAAA